MATREDGPEQATASLNDSDAAPHRVTTFFEQASPSQRIPGEMAERLPEFAAELTEAGHPGALDEAVDLLRQAVAATPGGHHDRVRYLFALDNALERRFELTGVLADIEEAVEVSRQAVATVPRWHTDNASALANLGNALAMRFELTQASGDLDEAIKVGKKAKAGSSADHPARAQILNNLGANFLARFKHGGRAADLYEAIKVTRQAAGLLPRGHPAWASAAANLGSALEAQFDRTHDPADLDEAIDLSREAMGALPPRQPKLRGLQSNLGTALLTRFEQNNELADVGEAIELFRRAAETTPPGHSIREAILRNLANALLSRFEWASDLADLDEAIEMARQAAASGSTDLLINLGATLLTRYGRAGEPADLEEAIESYRQAAAGVPGDSSVQAVASSGLSVALLDRYERSGDTGDLERAIESGRRAVAGAPGGGRSADKTDALSNLGNALRRRFERYGNMADLDEAIKVSREAVAATPASDPGRAMKLSNFAGILYRRFERAGELAFLDEAIEVNQQAVAADPDPPNRAICLANLGSGLRIRFERTGVQADSDQATAVLRQALAATPIDHADRARRLSDLGNALCMQFRHSGTPHDLDEAIEVSKQALAAMPADHAGRARYLANLGNCLAARAEHSGVDADLGQAIENHQQAVAATLAGHPIRAALLINLADALRRKFARTGVAADLNQAIEASREAAETATAPAHIRARAARLWGQAAADDGDWAGAAEGYAMAVGLLTRVAPRGLGRSDQEYWLGALAGVGTQAAACFLQAGQPNRAVELWEQGRGVLLSQALDTRTDLTRLIKRYPQLANKFVRLCEELDQTPDSDDPAVVNHELNLRYKAADELDQIIATIRKQQGFDRFLLPPPAGELLAAASQGPIVLLNVSDIRSDALLLTSTGVEVVPLPELTPDSVAHQVAEFMTALNLCDSPRLADHAEQQLLEVLAWLWESLARPVLDRLGDMRPGQHVVRGRGPRVWWCPSGLLAFLPLHAAGDHTTRFDAVPKTVLDRVVSSYTPTVRALIHARRADFTQAGDSDVRAESDRLLVVAMPHTPDKTSLREVVNEAIQLRDMCPSQVTILHGELEPDEAGRMGTGNGAQADFETVREALPRCRWAHFACHAASDMTRPSASHLLLTDHQRHPLTVVDLARLRLDDAELAFLSACSTARSGDPQLADEAIHLSAAFQLAGYRHVIATLWPIGDKSARNIAAQFYAGLVSGQTLPRNADASALTLHNTILRYRNFLEARSPWRWAAHMHSGV